MKIDSSVGSFGVDDEVVLSPHLTRAAFLASRLGRSAQQMVRNDPWLSLAFPVPGEPIRAVLQFEGERLRSICFACTDERFGNSWAEWSEDAERERARETVTWLETHGLKLDTYGWGTVQAGYDERSGGGSAAVTYVQLP